MEPAAATSLTAVLPARPSIRSAAKDCEAVFCECLQHPELHSLEDQLGRFRLWAANIEVFAKSRASLDYRLRQNEGTRDMVLQLLQVLHMTINFGRSTSLFEGGGLLQTEQLFTCIFTGSQSWTPLAKHLLRSFLSRYIYPQESHWSAPKANIVSRYQNDH
jgi:hypothetical protein